MSNPTHDTAAGGDNPRGNFDAEVNVRRSKDTHPHLRATLTRAADGKSYTASLWMTVEERPHPETGEVVKTRVLSGPLQPTDLRAALDHHVVRAVRADPRRARSVGARGRRPAL